MTYLTIDVDKIMLHSTIVDINTMTGKRKQNNKFIYAIVTLNTLIL